MLRWYEALPDEFIHTDPELCFFSAWMLFENGQYDVAEENLQIVERLTKSSSGTIHRKGSITSGLHSLEKNELLGKVAVIRAYIASFKQDISEILKLSEIALAYLPDSSLSWRATAFITQGDAYYFSGNFSAAVRRYTDAAAAAQKSAKFFVNIAANNGLAKIKRHQGDLPGAIDLFEQVLQQAKTAGLSRTPMMGWIHLRFGEVLIELNRLQKANDQIQLGLACSRQGEDASMMGQGYLYLAQLAFIKSDIAGAQSAIQQIDAIAADANLPEFVTEPLNELKVRLWLRQNKIKAALQWMKEHPLIKDEPVAFSLESKYIQHARIMLTLDKPDETLALLQEPLALAEKEGRNIDVVKILLLKAIALNTLEDKRGAISVLVEALELAYPSGCMAIFLNEGPIMASLLEKILGKKVKIPSKYLKKIVSAFKINKLIHTDDGPVARLSDRELEVLRFLAVGLSNKKIMEELFISMSTVKTHLRSIYSKLGVDSRIKAVAKAKGLELL